MTKVQFLLFFLSALPFVGVLLVGLVKSFPQLLGKITLTLSLIFLINAFGLLSNYLTNHNDTLILLNMNREIAVGLSIEPISLIFLILMSFIWLGLTCYSNQFFILSADQRLAQFQMFLCLNIGFIILIIFLSLIESA